MTFRGTPTTRVCIDPDWKPLLTEVCELKDALDHAFRWHGKGGNEQWINSALKRHGLELDDFRWGSGADGPHFAEEFVQMLLGAEFTHTGISKPSQMMVIPPWAVLGWVRKDGYMTTPSESCKRLKFEARDLNNWDTNAYTSYWAGFPLFRAGEGKNRTQLQRLAGVHRRAPVYEMPFPDLKGFVARPVPFLPWAVAIHSDKFEVQVLPFRKITEELVKKLGLAWSPTPSWVALLKLMCLINPLQLSRWRKQQSGGVGHYLRLRLIGGAQMALDNPS